MPLKTQKNKIQNKISIFTIEAPKEFLDDNCIGSKKHNAKAKHIKITSNND